jgi:hypothetical protein
MTGFRRLRCIQFELGQRDSETQDQVLRRGAWRNNSLGRFPKTQAKPRQWSHFFAGGCKKSIAVPRVHEGVACPGGPFEPFGNWATPKQNPGKLHFRATVAKGIILTQVTKDR